MINLFMAKWMLIMILSTPNSFNGIEQERIQLHFNDFDQVEECFNDFSSVYEIHDYQVLKKTPYGWVEEICE